MTKDKICYACKKPILKTQWSFTEGRKSYHSEPGDCIKDDEIRVAPAKPGESIR